MHELTISMVLLLIFNGFDIHASIFDIHDFMFRYSHCKYCYEYFSSQILYLKVEDG
jgi:hypothetical protein